MARLSPPLSDPAESAEPGFQAEPSMFETRNCRWVFDDDRSKALATDVRRGKEHCVRTQNPLLNRQNRTMVPEPTTPVGETPDSDLIFQLWLMFHLNILGKELDSHSHRKPERLWQKSLPGSRESRHLTF
jgi:hypothetical protein